MGVVPQYATNLGKQANCQTLVSLTLAQGEVPVPVALRLFLPESWTRDAERLDKAGVPGTDSLTADKMLARSKWRRITWRQGTKGRLHASCAAVRVRVADGRAIGSAS